LKHKIKNKKENPAKKPVERYTPVSSVLHQVWNGGFIIIAVMFPVFNWV